MKDLNQRYVFDAVAAVEMVDKLAGKFKELNLTIDNVNKTQIKFAQGGREVDTALVKARDAAGNLYTTYIKGTETGLEIIRIQKDQVKVSETLLKTESGRKQILDQLNKAQNKYLELTDAAAKATQIQTTEEIKAVNAERLRVSQVNALTAALIAQEGAQERAAKAKEVFAQRAATLEARAFQTSINQRMGDPTRLFGVPKSLGSSDIIGLNQARQAMRDAMIAANISAKQGEQIFAQLTAGNFSSIKATHLEFANSLNKLIVMQKQLGFERAAKAKEVFAQRAATLEARAFQTSINQRMGDPTRLFGVPKSLGSSDIIGLNQARQAMRDAMIAANISAKQGEQIFAQLTAGNFSSIKATHLEFANSLNKLIVMQKQLGFEGAKSFKMIQTSGLDSARSIHVTWQNFARFAIIHTLYRGAYQLVQMLREGITTSIELQKRISEIRTISQKDQQTPQELFTGIAKISGNTGKDIQDIAEGTYQTISNQIATGKDALAFVETAAKFARATNSSVADSVNLLSSALNAYGLDARNATEVSAKMFQLINLGRVRASEMADTFGRVAVLASEMGISMDELSAVLSVITIKGTRYSEAFTQVNAISQALLKPTKEMTEFIREQGYASGEALIAGKGFVGFLELMRKELDKGGASRIADLFANVRGLRGILSSVSQGVESGTLGKVMNEFKDAAKIYKEASEQIASESPAVHLEQEWAKLKNSVLPLATWVTGFLAQTFENLNSWPDILKGASVRNFEEFKAKLEETGAQLNKELLKIQQTQDSLIKTANSELISRTASVNRGAAESFTAFKNGSVGAIEAIGAAFNEANKKIQELNEDSRKATKTLEDLRDLKNSLSEKRETAGLDAKLALITPIRQQKLLRDSADSATAKGKLALESGNVQEARRQFELAQDFAQRAAKVGETTRTTLDNTYAKIAEINKSFAAKITELEQNNATDLIDRGIVDSEKKRLIQERDSEISKLKNRALSLSAELRVVEGTSVDIVKNITTGLEADLRQVMQEQEALIARQEQLVKGRVNPKIPKEDSFDKLPIKHLTDLTTEFDKAGGVFGLPNPAKFREDLDKLMLELTGAFNSAPQQYQAAWQAGLDLARKFSAEFRIEQAALDRAAADKKITDERERLRQNSQEAASAAAKIRAKIIELGNTSPETLAKDTLDVGNQPSVATGTVSGVLNWLMTGNNDGTAVPLLRSSDLARLKGDSETLKSILTSAVRDPIESFGDIQKRATDLLEDVKKNLRSTLTLDENQQGALLAAYQKQYVQVSQILTLRKQEQQSLDAQKFANDAITQSIDAQMLKQNTTLQIVNGTATITATIPTAIDKATASTVQLGTAFITANGPATGFSSTANLIATTAERTAAAYDRAAAALAKMQKTDTNKVSNMVRDPFGTFTNVSSGVPNRTFENPYGLASGGLSGVDTVPAMLSPGEFVVNAQSAKRYYHQLIMMNSGAMPRGMASGGDINVGDITVNVTGQPSATQSAREIGVALRREIKRGTIRI